MKNLFSASYWASVCVTGLPSTFGGQGQQASGTLLLCLSWSIDEPT